MIRTMFKTLAAAVLAASVCLSALGAEAGGIKFDDTAKVAGKDLKLNGLGVRVRAVFKVYAIGLYLPAKKTTTADVLASEGPRRIQLTMMRDVTGDDFGQAFMTGMNNNTDKAEKSKIVSQMTRFGEMFASRESLVKGDMLTVDWVPEKGMVIELNKKPLGDPIPDVAFYNALLKIWLGEKPVDTSLKPLLLGEAEAGK